MDLQAPGEGTKASSLANWLSKDLEQDLVAHLKESIPELDGLEPLCPKLIHRWDAPPWKGFRIPHRDFSLGHRIAGRCMVLMIALTLWPPSKSLHACPGSQGGYHASTCWDIVVRPIRSLTVLRGTVIYCGAGEPGRTLFIPFVPRGLRTRMVTVEREAVTELMHSTPVMPASVVEKEEEKEKENVQKGEKENEEVETEEET